MFRIRIPKPCQEDWNTMTPTQQGAFCAACSKEVVDFTKLTDEEVQHYFLKNVTGKTCGRFRSEQVDRIRIYLPENVLLQKIAGWKKFMVVLLLAFGSMLFGCDVGTQTTTLQKKMTDSVQVQRMPPDTMPMVGEIAPAMGTPVEVKTDTVSCSVSLLGAVVAPPVQELQGDIAIMPDTVVTKGEIAYYDSIFTGKILLGKKADTTIKKPASDTSKCNDTGYY